MPAGETSIPEDPARRVSQRPFVPDVITGILVVFQGFSELLGGVLLCLLEDQRVCKEVAQSPPEAEPCSTGYPD
jgi:hypothetical protein